MRNDLEDFKRCMRSISTCYDKLYTPDDHKTTKVSPNKRFESDFEKAMTNFLDSQIISNMFVKNTINDMILKIKQYEKNFQSIFKSIERKNGWFGKISKLIFGTTR